MKIGNNIYFDHQASTPLDSRVFDAMRPYFAETFGNPHSSDHSFGWHSAQAVDKSATKLADLIGCDADEMIFTSGATEANNLALLGLGKHAAGRARKRILLGATEHKCILTLGRVLSETFDYEITSLRVDDAGRIDLEFLESQLDETVLAVSTMAVNNEIGTIQDIPAISRFVRQTGSYLHCDAAQAPCAMEMTEFSQHVDMLSLSGHKIYGPLGIGALFISRDLQNEIEPIIYGGDQQNGLRSGTLPTPLCVGLGTAAQLANSDDSINERAALSRRRDMFIEGLEQLPQKTWLNGPASSFDRHPGNANIGFKGISASDLLSRVQPRLAASTGSACTSGIPEPSHVLRAIGLTDQSASSSIRFSLGRQTTDEDVFQAIEIISSALADMDRTGLLQTA
jgi:cysteine desulfurase